MAERVDSISSFNHSYYRDVFIACICLFVTLQNCHDQRRDNVAHCLIDTGKHDSKLRNGKLEDVSTLSTPSVASTNVEHLQVRAVALMNTRGTPGLQVRTWQWKILGEVSGST